MDENDIDKIHQSEVLDILLDLHVLLIHVLNFGLCKLEVAQG